MHCWAVRWQPGSPAGVPSLKISAAPSPHRHCHSPATKIFAAGDGGASGPASAVAPASDLATRRVTLRPWQLPEATGRPARRGSSPPPPQRMPPGPPDAERLAGSSSRVLGHAGPPCQGPCPRCGGRGVVVNSRGRPTPCPSCQPWSQRPDYEPSEPLLRLADLNLAALDVEPCSTGTPTAAASSSGSALATVQACGGGSMAAGGAAAAAVVRTAVGGAPPKKKRRGRPAGVQHGPMPESQRHAISQGQRRRAGKYSEEHRRNIALAMRDVHARNPQLARKPKRCGLCGEQGHNRRACPQAAGATAAAAWHTAAAEAATIAPAAGSTAGGRRRVLTCGCCGQPGHTRPRCPLLKGGKEGNAPPARKLIVVEEVDVVGARLSGAGLPAASGAADSQGTGTGTDPGTGSVASAAGPSPTAALQPPPQQQQQQGKLERQQPQAAAGLWRPPLAVTPAPLVLPPEGPLGLSPDGSLVFPLPRSKEQCVSQAAAAVLRAWEDGQRRQSLQLLLPQGSAGAEAGWPGGIRQQFRVALPLVEGLLLRLKRVRGLEGRITTEMLDEGDCVGAWQSERLAAVLFPTADTLPALQRIDDALSGSRLTLIVNPQWHSEGQVVSDFGFGRARKRAELFVGAFEPTYYLQRVRILGDDVRVLCCYPSQWQVHWVQDPGRPPVLLSCEDQRPTYKRLLELLQGVRGSRASRGWLERIMSAGSRGTWDDCADYCSEEEGGWEGSSGDGGALHEGAAAPCAGAEGAASTRDGWRGDRDIVTNEPISRDIRLDAVEELRRLLRQP